MANSAAERVRCARLKDRIISADAAAAMISDGMNVVVPTFTSIDRPLSIGKAVLRRAEATGSPKNLTLITSANGHDIFDNKWAQAGLIKRRLDWITEPVIRKYANTPGGVHFQDVHLSHAAEQIKHGWYGGIDYVLLSVTGVTEEGHLLPSFCQGFSQLSLTAAKNVILEINTHTCEDIHVLHDVYEVGKLPVRDPIPIRRPGDIIGRDYYECDLDKIRGIVISDEPLDFPPAPAPVERGGPLAEMAGHFIRFLKDEVAAGRLPEHLLPLQIGVGAAADAVVSFLGENFTGLTMYSETLGFGAMELLEKGVVSCVSTGGISATEDMLNNIMRHPERYRGRLVIRPTEITNNPEVIKRLGLISMNNAVEADIYGNINSSHVMGSRIISGIGGSCDFSRNAYLSVFFTLSTAKGGKLSSIVPFCSHIDSTEHDVKIIVTEHGVADLRNCSPWERAQRIIAIAHPDFRPQLQDYYDRAAEKCRDGRGHTPHILSEALSWHVRAEETGSML